MKRDFGWLALLLALLLLAAALRFHRLDAQSLWYDEGITAAHSARSLPELVPLLQVNVHTPAYFLLLAGWTDVAGDSELALRLPSALFSLLSVAFAYSLGARLYGRLAGWAAAALVALNSFSIFYAQEARMYAMLAAIAGFSMCLFIQLLRGRGRRGRTVVAFGLVNALGIYTQIVFALVMLGQALTVGWWLLRARPPSSSPPTSQGEAKSPPARTVWQILVDYGLANCLAVLLFLPWLPHSLQQVFSRPNRAQVLPPDEVLQVIAGHFAFGSNYALDMGLAWLVFGCLLLAGALPLGASRGGWRWLLLLAWLGISVVAYVALELTTRYLRFLLPAQLAFALLLGRGLWILWPQRLSRLLAMLALAAALLTMLAGLDSFYQHSDFQRDDMRGLVRGIAAVLRPDDGVIFSAPGLVDLLNYYYRSDAPTYALPSSRDDDEATRSQVADIIQRHERLHVIFYGEREQDPRQVVEDTLNRQAYEISDRWVGDLRYLQYASPTDLREPVPADWQFGDEITLHDYALNATALAGGEHLLARLTWSARQSLATRYKVALQLLDGAGILVAQRDSQPVGGAAPTIGWQAGELIVDQHGLMVPPGLPAGEYRLILSLYAAADPFARLLVDDADHVVLSEITVSQARS
ncbi:MAG: glycosyltransferase family 39 protein [Chloroflexi bacterium]|nr:glycosyltransferase family 39 protein [Chloroflexota bacterium]MCY3582119.1 glycosyltransferase family 39 protein [Chloroflexota bacterium]MCY3717842.1 glycosyltransferase family 39 protein [Chloroflexota bacterium]MDE2649813.1 glycosyltransferase family 39 protein [Chloroflexota bacterium]